MTAHGEAWRTVVFLPPPARPDLPDHDDEDTGDQE